MNLDYDQASEEKDNDGLPLMLFVVLAVFLLIPFAGMSLFADTLNPFDLKGRSFLAFYAVLSGVVYGIAYALRATGMERIKAASRDAASTGLNIAKWLVKTTVLLGTARLVRGIYLGRPVIFLCLMMLAHAVIYSVFFKKR